MNAGEGHDGSWEWRASAEELKIRQRAIGQASQAQVKCSLIASVYPIVSRPVTHLACRLVSVSSSGGHRENVLGHTDMQRSCAAVGSLNTLPEAVPLTAYEQQRADNMARNARLLDAMGLGVEQSHKIFNRRK